MSIGMVRHHHDVWKKWMNPDYRLPLVAPTSIWSGTTGSFGFSGPAMDSTDSFLNYKDRIISKQNTACMLPEAGDCGNQKPPCTAERPCWIPIDPKTIQPWFPTVHLRKESSINPKRILRPRVSGIRNTNTQRPARTAADATSQSGGISLLNIALLGGAGYLGYKAYKKYKSKKGVKG